MPLAIGNEATAANQLTENEGQAVGFGPLNPAAFKTLASISFKTGTSANTTKKWFAAIAKDAAGAPGEILQAIEVKSTPGTSTIVTTTGFSVLLEEGKKYWLLILPTEGALHLLNTVSGESTERKSNSVTLPSLKTGETVEGGWKAALAKGPLQLWGSYEPAGTDKGAAGAESKNTGNRQVSGTDKGTVAPASTAVGAKAKTGEGVDVVGVGALSQVTGIRSVSVTSKGTAAPGSSATGGRAQLKLIGSEVPLEAGFGALTIAGKGEWFQFTADQSGYVQAVHFFIGATDTSAEVRVGVFEENAGKPGALIGVEGARTGAAGFLGTERLAEVPITGLGTVVTKGQKYWLALLSPSGSFKIRVTKEKGTPSLEGKAGVAKLSLETEWEVNSEHGPMQLWAGGQEIPHSTASSGAGAGGVSTGGIKSVAIRAEATTGAKAKITGKKEHSEEGVDQVSMGASSLATAHKVLTTTYKSSVGIETTAVGHGGNPTVWNYETGVKMTGQTGVPPEPNPAPGIAKEWAGIPFVEMTPAKGTNAPLCVVVHGGGWTQGYLAEWATGEKVATELWRGGCASANVEYPLAESAFGAFSIEVDYVVKAVEFVVANASIVNGDPTKLYLVGGSAGGHLVLAAAMKLAEKGKAPLGVITCSAFCPDLRKLAEELETESNALLSGDSALVTKCQQALHQNLPGGTKITANDSNNGRKPETTTQTVGENTPAARGWQEMWSPARMAVAAKMKYLLISSEFEVVSVAQTTAMRVHLEEVGRWEAARSKQILRTAAKTGEPSPGFVEEATGTGKGHGFGGYASKEMTNILAFIFAPETAVTTGVAPAGRIKGSRSVTGVTFRGTAGAADAVAAGKVVTSAVTSRGAPASVVAGSREVTVAEVVGTAAPVSTEASFAARFATDRTGAGVSSHAEFSVKREIESMGVESRVVVGPKSAVARYLSRTGAGGSVVGFIELPPPRLVISGSDLLLVMPSGTTVELTYASGGWIEPA